MIWVSDDLMYLLVSLLQIRMTDVFDVKSCPVSHAIARGLTGRMWCSRTIPTAVHSAAENLSRNCKF